MSFYSENTALMNKKARKELSRYQSLFHPAYKKTSFTCSGSLTIEASLVLPAFLMLMVCFLLLFDVLRFQLCLQSAMDCAAKQVSAFYYAVEQVSEEEDRETLEGVDGIVSELLTWGITAAYVRTLILDRLEKETDEAAWLKGGYSGLTLLQSRFPDEDGAIDLIVSYQVKLPFLPDEVVTLNLSQRSRRFVWSGTVRWKAPAEEDGETLVYITEHGSVYHTSLECSHLKLAIRSVSASEVEGLRNSGGGRYDACELCKEELSGFLVYVTENGDCYHSRLNCSGLTRNIRRINRNQTSLSACSRCGKEIG